MTTPIPGYEQRPDSSFEGIRFAMDSMAPGPLGRSYMGAGQDHLGPQFSSPGLVNTQQRINSMVPAGVRQTGSPNGMSVRQAAATMNGFMKPQNGVANRQYEFTQGGMLPNQEGTAADTFMAKRFFGNGVPNGGT